MDIGAVKSLIKKHGLSPENKTKLESIADNATSKYMDIGDVRIQWGRSTTNVSTITFPTAFKDIGYALIPGFANGDTGTRLYSVVQGARTTSSVVMYKKMEDSAGNMSSCSAELLDWVAVGLKP